MRRHRFLGFKNREARLKDFRDAVDQRCSLGAEPPVQSNFASHGLKEKNAPVAAAGRGDLPPDFQPGEVRVIG